MMLTELKALVLLAETGSIQAVANRIPLTQPAVTRQLQRLEEVLGTTLLDRRAKPARLTSAGLAVLGHARKVLAAFEELKNAAAVDASPAGDFRVGIAHALAESGVVNSLQYLKQNFPDLNLRLTAGWTNELIPKVDKGELDAALVMVAGARDSLAMLPGPVLARDDLVFLASRNLALPRTPSLGELNRFGWILTPDTLCGSRASLRGAVEKNGSQFRISAEVHDMALQASLIERGLGIGMLPKRKATSLKRSGLRAISVRGLDLQMQIALVRAPYLGRLQAVVDGLQESLAVEFRRNQSR